MNDRDRSYLDDGYRAGEPDILATIGWGVVYMLALVALGVFLVWGPKR